MTPDEVRRAQALLGVTVFQNPYIPREPTEKQALFLSLTCEEALYGGAAGGGKTEAALMAAAQFLPVPGYRALILRKTIPQLRQPNGLLERALSWWGSERWNESKKIFTFPHPDGPPSTVAFGSMESELDMYQWDGAELDFVGIDELRHLRERPYVYMLSRLRGTNPNIPRRLRGFTNPGADWIRKRFAIQKPCAENGRGRAMQVGLEGQVFVPAFLDENPYLLKNDPEYVKKLRKQDPVTRAQLESGDWWIEASGNMFDRAKFNRISRYRAPTEFDALVRAWDFAATAVSDENSDPDWTRGTLYGLLDGRVILLDMVSVRDRWFVVEQLLVDTTKADGAEVGVVMPQDPAQAGKSQFERFVAMLNAKVGSVSAYKYQPMKGEAKEVMARPVSSLVDSGNVDIVEAPWTDEVITEFGRFPSEDDKAHDDIVDTASAGVPRLTWIAARLGGRKVRVGVRREEIQVIQTSGRPRRPTRGAKP